MKHLNNNNFPNEISNGYTLVDFYTNWCGPCKMMAPIIEQLDQEIHNVAFAKVDVDQNQALAQQYQIHSIPTVILFKDGKVVAKFMGFLPKIEIVKFINKYVQ